MGWQKYIAVAAALWFGQVLYTTFTSPVWLPLKFASLTGNRIYFVHELHRFYDSVVRIAPNEVDISSLAGFREIHRTGSQFLKSKWSEKFLFLKKPGLRRVWELVIREKVQLAVSQILQDLKVDGKPDLLKWWMFLGTDVSRHLMFRVSFDMLHFGKKIHHIHVLESATKGSGVRAEFPLLAWPLLPYTSFFLPDYRMTGNASFSIFAGMVQESEKNGSIITDEDMASEAGSLIVAGVDTTAANLTCLIWAEVRLPLLNAVIMEALRLYGAAPRGLPRDTPEGGAMGENNYADAESFNVDPWLATGTDASEVAKKAFTFGAGRVRLGLTAT
ncbi:cytochrome P450 [Aspergillus alliaceus]|uniref:cytochrome P450 n=1 Tax=Petromyces alliaceus TaxID=209559 RepID=UPI0012A507EE|nr:cytochrome P450 [Aspergillus alliaceus]KAB8238694.1 cytochrome P450 [Aspergillus alliaceus]